MKKKSETLKEYHLRVHRKIEDTLEQDIADLHNSRKSEDTDDFMDKFVHEPIALLFSRMFIKLGFSPNEITVLSMVFGISGGILFYPRKLLLNALGIAAQIFAAILDCCDGQVARMTGNSTQLGRVLDGIVDGINFGAVYLALGFRMMQEEIPFTDGVLWGGWIWPVILFCGIVSHSSQARMADYYRVVHLFFGSGKDLATSDELREEAREARLREDMLSFHWLNAYSFYTTMQERSTPKLQRLLTAINANGGTVPYGADTAYVEKSCKIIQMTNLLTFCLRAYLLYILLLTDLYPFYFPFVIIVMGLMKHGMIFGYERIAGAVFAEYFGAETGV